MIKSVTSVKLAGKRVIVRAGFDVPLRQNIQTNEWEVADETRIKDVLTTLKYLIDQKAKIVIIAHLDRPEGWDPNKSLWPAAKKLGELLSFKTIQVKDDLPSYDVNHVYFLTEDITKKDFSDLTAKMRGGEILFLENLRFYQGEQDNDVKFIETLASFGDVYVDEAFSVAHRKEASTFGLAQRLPHYGGVSFLKEIHSLQKVMRHPHPPFIVIMGGIKIQDKVETLRNLARNANYIIVGGGIANTFLKVKGYEVGKSKISDIETAKELLRNYKEKIITPIDVVVAQSPDDKPRAVTVDKVRSNDLILDVGPASIRKYSEIIKQAKTLVWNGPFGMLEKPQFAKGSRALALLFSSQAKGKAFGVIGGGETVEVVDQTKVTEFIDHISTGGGAMLEFLAGKDLPAIKVLES